MKWYNYLNPMYWVRRYIQYKIQKEMLNLFQGMGEEATKDFYKNDKTDNTKKIID